MHNSLVPTLPALVLVAAALVPPAWLDGGPPLCPFRWATGLPCPGCGLTRSVVALAHGDLSGAWFFHPLGPLAVAAISCALVGPLVARAASRSPGTVGAGPPTVRLLDRRLRPALGWLSAALLVAVWLARLPLFLSGTWVY